MTILQYFHIQRRNFHMAYNREPDKVFMHPATWTQFVKIIRELYHLPYINEKRLNFMGIDVCRSLDVEENKFEFSITLNP